MQTDMENVKYNVSPYYYQRIKTIPVQVGQLMFGSDYPIRIQSMTTADTMDTEKSVEECVALYHAGCEMIRLTAPSKKEAENLKHIKSKLLELGIETPLVADIHFTPNAADIAAELVEKVRINPGNFADKKKFEDINYTDESYQQELKRIEEKFIPFLNICKKHQTAVRIGTNHGSLSDRILSRYGDTPEGMVESAFEFIRICEKENFDQIIISMKASNTLVMMHAYRLMVSKMLETGKCYPIHLGVTEAGDGEDGRIKSAIGIGTLLLDGIGDTLRVSLTEDAVHEIPVARKIVQTVLKNQHIKGIEGEQNYYSPFQYQRRKTNEILGFGSNHYPRVIAHLANIEQTLKPAHLFAFGYQYQVATDKYNLKDQAVDAIYIGNHRIDFQLPGNLIVFQNYEVWKQEPQANHFPVVTEQWEELPLQQQAIFEIPLDFTAWDELKKRSNLLLQIQVTIDNFYLIRNFMFNIAKNEINNPIIYAFNSDVAEEEQFQIEAAIQLGAHIIDGQGDGIMIQANCNNQIINSTAFNILQATRTRITKTEYISCPSCGRTLFDLQDTTNMIRKETAHLKGLKIGIMGCIVNGPGEMADADYGYVGSGVDKITLYKKQEVVRKNIPTEEAVQALIQLIKDNGDWIDAR